MLGGFACAYFAGGKAAYDGMILTCPQCATRYQADAARFGSAGRTVRCAKCGHTWHQEPPAPEEEASAEIERPPPEPAFPVPPPRPIARAPNPVISRDVEEIAPRPAPQWTMRIAVAAGWIALAAVIAAIVWAGVTYRQQIVSLWPQSASVYSAAGLKANASGIDISDVAYHRDRQDGQSVLTVSGRLTNITDRELSVPQMRVTLSDGDGRELYHWSFAPSVLTLHPGQITKFVTRLSNPPAGARQFEVRFARAGE